MSLQGPIIVVADEPASNLVEALSAAGGFPVVEAKWADAPTAFVAVKPVCLVIAEAGAPPSEPAARMLCLQIATMNGPVVPVVARVSSAAGAALPIALPADTALPVDHLIARLRTALRVRALHATVLRRIESFAAQDGRLPALPVGDALEEATVLIAGRGPLYPTLSVAIGERVNMLGALSLENAARHLETRDIDGIVVGDGFSPRTVEAFLAVLAQEPRFRDLPVTVIGKTPVDLTASLPNCDVVDGEPARLIPRLIPLVRQRAFEMQLKRMLASLDADGMFDPANGLLAAEVFWRDLNKAISEASERSQALSMARLSFDGPHDGRAVRAGARLLKRLIRNIDFAMRDDDGALLIVFTQTDLRSAHIVARRIAGALRNAMFPARHPLTKITANVTLVTLKAGDTLDSLLMRVTGSRSFAAE